jgi:hypothetical protein
MKKKETKKQVPVYCTPSFKLRVLKQAEKEDEFESVLWCKAMETYLKKVKG